MFTKTRIPKHTNCVRFHASRHAEAYRLASLFLGGKGRLANAIDLIEARVKYGFKHPIWSCYITTSSTEWFGLNREGQPVIVVLHSPSPLADEKLLRENYVSKKENNHKFNVIPRQMFLDVLDGKYGEVKIVSLTDAIVENNENEHQYNFLKKSLVEKSKVVKARLGNYNSFEKYITTHFTGSMQENLDNNKHRSGEIETAFLNCDCDDYFPSFIGLTRNPQKFTLDLSKSPINLETEAVGHFITFGAVVNTNSNMLTSEIDLSTTNADCAFLAITDEKEPILLNGKVCMYSGNKYREHIASLFIPNESSVVSEFYQLDNLEQWYFTQRKREKITIGDKQQEWFVTTDPTYCIEGELEFLVKSLKPLGRRTIKIPVSKGYYTLDDIKKTFKHTDFNAFQVIRGFNRRGKYYICVVECYKAEVYTDRIIPTEAEILKEYKLLGRII